MLNGGSTRTAVGRPERAADGRPLCCTGAVIGCVRGICYNAFQVLRREKIQGGWQEIQYTETADYPRTVRYPLNVTIREPGETEAVNSVGVVRPQTVTMTCGEAELSVGLWPFTDPDVHWSSWFGVGGARGGQRFGDRGALFQFRLGRHPVTDDPCAIAIVYKTIVAVTDDILAFDNGHGDSPCDDIPYYRMTHPQCLVIDEFVTIPGYRLDYYCITGSDDLIIAEMTPCRELFVGGYYCEGATCDGLAVYADLRRTITMHYNTYLDSDGTPIDNGPPPEGGVRAPGSGSQFVTVLGYIKYTLILPVTAGPITWDTFADYDAELIVEQVATSIGFSGPTTSLCGVTIRELNETVDFTAEIGAASDHTEWTAPGPLLFLPEPLDVTEAYDGGPNFCNGIYDGTRHETNYTDSGSALLWIYPAD